jgi:hypothetical protein
VDRDRSLYMNCIALKEISVWFNNCFRKLFLTYILLTACAPPPGRYDPKFEDKVKGAVIEKSERFVEPKSIPVSSNLFENPSNSSLASSSSKSASVNCLPVFRTVSIN